MPSYFLYARKSTDIEDKQVLSIETQLTELRALAKEQNLKIASEFIEKQSAKSLGRPVFTDMLSRLENREANGIICWKLDRLARNPVDGGQISWFLQRGIIEHIQTHERSYHPTDNVLLMSMEFGMANQFILDLSSNTKRGLREKVRQGDYPSRAPIGYLNDSRTKTIIVDKRISKIIKEMFELYAKGDQRLEDISIAFKARGIAAVKSGKRFKRGRITSILSDPFYYGFFEYKGELHPGRHKPIITKQLFDQVQVVLRRRGHRRDNPKNLPEPLCGLFKCAECNCSITAERKIKRQQNGNTHYYTYYRCTKKKTFCSQPFIREEELDSQLSNLLKPYAMPKAWADGLNQRAEQDMVESTQATAPFLQGLRSKIVELDRKLARLKELYLDQDIDQAEFRHDKNEFLSEKKSLEEQIARLERQQNVWLEPFQNWLKEAQMVDEIAISSVLTSKKSLAQKIFGSNLCLSDKKVVVINQEQSPYPSGSIGEFPSKTQWTALWAARKMAIEKPLSFVLEPIPGVEPGTSALRKHCSTN